MKTYPSIFNDVIGPLSNNIKFYEVFGIKPGDAMYRPENERVSIW